MFDDCKVFLLTETNTRNYLEYAGNLLLLPARLAWNGHTIKVGHFPVLNKDFKKVPSSLEIHCQLDSGTNDPLIKLLNIIISIFTIAPGILFKGIAYLCSSSVRERHANIIESLNPNPQLPEGITMDIVRDDDNRIDGLRTTLKLDCSHVTDQNEFETYLGKKILELKSRLAFNDVICNFDFGGRIYNPQRKIKLSEESSEEVTLDEIFFSRHLRNTQLGRCRDKENIYGLGCYIGDDLLIRQ